MHYLHNQKPAVHSLDKLAHKLKPGPACVKELHAHIKIDYFEQFNLKNISMWFWCGWDLTSLIVIINVNHYHNKENASENL